MQNLSNHARFFRLAAATASGTSTVETDSVDLSLGEGVVFLVYVATAAANVVIHAAQSPDDIAFVRTAGGVVPTVSGNLVVIDLYRPRQTMGRWGRLEIVRGTATALGDVLAIPYNGRRRGAGLQTTGVDLAQLISPAEAS